jgi:hypothetical protein
LDIVHGVEVARRWIRFAVSRRSSLVALPVSSVSSVFLVLLLVVASAEAIEYGI